MAFIRHLGPTGMAAIRGAEKVIASPAAQAVMRHYGGYNELRRAIGK